MKDLPPDQAAPKDGAPDPESLTSRELQDNPSQGPLETTPGSDADHAAEVPHVG